MKYGKSILGMKHELRSKVNESTDRKENYENAPLCRYPNGGCICKRILGNGPTKCFYNKAPDECCFEKDQPKEILEKSRIK